MLAQKNKSFQSKELAQTNLYLEKQTFPKPNENKQKQYPEAMVA